MNKNEQENEQGNEQSICNLCNESFDFTELSKVIGEDINLCGKCLINEIVEGKKMPFTEDQLYEIIKKYGNGVPYKNEAKDNQEGGVVYVNSEDMAGTDSKKSIEIGRILNDLSKEGKLDKLIGREEELKEIMMILSRKYKSNPVLIGDPGVGKTAIVEGLASLIESGKVPAQLQGKKILEVSASELVAGTRYRGEFEERFEQMMKKARDDGNTIIFFDEIHSLAGAGKTESSDDAISMLKPYITSGDVQIIGSTTHDEYRKHLSQDKAIVRRMQNVDIKEPSESETFEIINGMKESLEEHHGVKYTEEAIKKAIRLSNRYLTDRNQPDKTIDLLDESAALEKIKITKSDKDAEEIKNLEDTLERVKKMKDNFVIEEKLKEAKQELEKEKGLNKQIANKKREMNEVENSITDIDGSDIDLILEKRTGIPVKNLDESERESVKNLEVVIKERIKGQDKAVNEVSKHIKRAKLNLKDPDRPSGVFLFLGPTGVGKTELAKVLSEELFGSEKNMIRFDMSEYMEKNSANKLIGAPPGYLGYEDGGELVNRIKKQPYSLILFDEIEKAHPDVMNVMLQLFEDGIITDNRGETVDAKNTIIILTSNAGGSVRSKGKLGFGKVENKEEEDKIIIDRIREDNFFKPEFLNRLDSIVVFNELTDEVMGEIVEKMTKNFSERMKQQGYEVTFDDSAKNHLKKIGYKPEYGARELKRKVESVADILSDAILETNGTKYTVKETESRLTLE